MKKRILYIIFIFSVIAFTESSIPFWYAKWKCRPENVFLGQTISTFDQNMYFSFIRQAANGHFIFCNRLTYMDHKSAFINLEFWLVGMVQRVTGVDENTVYTLWRLAGVILLVTGFVLIASLLFRSTGKICCATAVFLFSGGIGFLHAALNKFGFREAVRGWAVFGSTNVSSLALDTSCCIMPFNQMMTNPHFSFPTGIILIGFFLFLNAERRTDRRFYYFSGAVFFLIGLIRPYDLLPVVCVFPLYALLSSDHTVFFQKDNLRKFADRLAPFFLSLPVLLYNVWLFHWHPVFRYWSVQGDNSDMIPSFPVHFLNFGIIGLLAVFRLVLIKKFPLQKAELFLSLLFAVTFMLNHAGRYTSFTPWSFQVGAFAAAPLALIGFVPEYRKLVSSPFTYRVFLCCVGAGALISNIAILSFRCHILGNPSNRSHMYAGKDEYDSWIWLRTHTKPDEILLSSGYSSSRIAKYTDLRVVAGHPFVAPEYDRICQMAMNISIDSQIGPVTRVSLEQLRVNYIYLGPGEKLYDNYKIKTSDVIYPVFSNRAVDIYKVNRSALRKQLSISSQK